MKKRIATSIIITVVLLFAAAAALAAPGIPGIVAGTVAIATQEDPAVLAFNGYRGSYTVIPDCDVPVRMYLYDYQDDGNLHYLGMFTRTVDLTVSISGTFIVVVYPQWDGESVTLLVVR